MQPLIQDGQPSRKPLRGPLDQPAAVSTVAGLESLIEENNQLLLLTEEVLNGKVQNKAGGSSDVTDAVPFLERLQRNLIYLALLAEQKTGPLQQQPQQQQQQQDMPWTKDEVERLRAGFQMYGENPELLASYVGTKSGAEIARVMEQWRNKQ
jgi:Myb-like DNA-binding domain